MLTLIVTGILGLGFALFAVQNTEPVSLNFGSYTFAGIPVYLLILIPLLVGVLLSWFINLAKGLSQSLTINEQKDKLKESKKEVAELTKMVHKLELENTKLKTEQGKEEDENAI